MQDPDVGRPAERSYRSPLRQRQAEQTRTAVDEAAASLFAQHGYTRTSLRQVAAAAGVSVETVNALGGKAAVFLRAFERAFSGTTNGGSLLDLEAMTTALESNTLAKAVAGMTDVISASNQRSAGLWTAYVEAANTDPVLAAAYADRMQDMRTDGRRVLAAMVDRGLCPAPADPDSTVDQVWIVLHPRQYVLLVTHARWDLDRYRVWMQETVTSLLRE